MKTLKSVFIKLHFIASRYFSIIRFIILGRKKDYLLLCTPMHGNLGDQTIAIAEMEFLKKENVSYFEVTAENLDNMYDFYSKFSPPDQKIIIHGGGFLGSVWPKEEYRFRKILEKFNKKKIIVLPQTITFDLSDVNDISFFKESYKIYRNHNNIVFFLRDSNSVEFVKKFMPDLKYYYVPDIVLSFIYRGKKAKKRENILFLKRHDIENKLSDDENIIIKECINKKFPKSNFIYSDTCLDHPIFPKQRKKLIEKKLFDISSYKLIVTDRLHGMVFAYLTDTPCLALNNKNGKVKAVYSWIQDRPNIKFCENLNLLDNCIDEILNSDEIKDYSFDKAYDSLRFVLRK